MGWSIPRDSIGSWENEDNVGLVKSGKQEVQEYRDSLILSTRCVADFHAKGGAAVSKFVSPKVTVTTSEEDNQDVGGNCNRFGGVSYRGITGILSKLVGRAT